MWDLITNIIVNNNVNVVYDIGAFKGEFTKKIYGIKPTANIYAFEANRMRSRPRWSKSIDTIQWFNKVLSNTIEERKFYSLGTTGDSLYKEVYNNKHKEKNVKIVTTDTLENIIKEHNLQLPEFIKIDVQGSELDVLSKTDLSKCVAIHCEIPMEGIVYNQDAPIRQEYFSFFDKKGFKYNKFIKNLRIGKQEKRTVVQQDYIFSKVKLDD